MPYIIAVLALVVLGAGYTLFQQTPETTLEVAENPTPEIVAVASQDQTAQTTTNDGLEVEVAQTPTKEMAPEETPSISSVKEQPAVPQPTPSPTPVPVADSNTYTNGTYSATKSYRTPNGTYQMNVSVTVNNDVVTASTLSFDSDGSHDGYSKRFSSGYQSQVIGKALGNINLTRVGGASLTTTAFNAAIANIVSQAS